MNNKENKKNWIAKLLMADTNAAAPPLYQAVLLHLFLILGVLISVLPFFFLITTTFKTYEESIKIPFSWFSKEPSLAAFKNVFQTLPFAKMFLNSVIVTAGITMSQVFFSAMAGFALALLKIPNKQLLLLICLAILMIPLEVYLIPQFLLIQKMGLVNTLIAIILPHSISVFGIFLFRQAFLSLPYSLYEAAVLDGCNPMKVFWHIMFPLVKPTIASFGIISAIGAWNFLLWSLIVNSDPSKSTLSVGMATLIGDREVKYPVLMAGATVALIPMIILFIVLRKYILTSNTYLGNK